PSLLISCVLVTVLVVMTDASCIHNKKAEFNAPLMRNQLTKRTGITRRYLGEFLQIGGGWVEALGDFDSGQDGAFVAVNVVHVKPRQPEIVLPLKRLKLLLRSVISEIDL